MGFFSDLFGGGSRKDIEKGRVASNKVITEGYSKGRGVTEDYYGRAQAFLEPQMQSGDRATAALETATGLRGRDAQAGYYDEFMDDPGFQAELDAGQRELGAGASARGYVLSGRALKEAQEFGQTKRRDAFNSRLDRFETMSGRGQQTRMGMAELAANTGRDLAQSHYGEAGTKANIELTSANARANTRFTIGDLGKLIGGAAKAYAAI